MIPAHSPQDPPIQNIHSVETSSLPIHSRLVVWTNHDENKEKEISGMKLSTDVITSDTTTCMPIKDIQNHAK